MVLKMFLLLAMSLGLFFTLSGSQRRVRQCVLEFTARRQAEKTVLPDYPTNPDPPGSQGLVLAAVLFDHEGTMAKVNVYESPGIQFTDVVTRALEQWKLSLVYNGAGEPLETQTVIRFHFIFEDGKGRVETASEDEQKEPRGEWVKVCSSRL